MSKNYELLQQAGYGLSGAQEWPKEANAAAYEPTEAPAQVVPFLEPSIREEALKLVHRLFLDTKLSPAKAVLFAATDANRDCDWLTAITGKLLAKSVPGSVCVVDGNLRRSSLPRVFGLEPERGVVDATQQEGPIRAFAKRVGPENLWLLSSGKVEDAALVLNSDRLKERVTELRKEFDFVVVNGPSLSSFADAFVLGRLLDGVVLVLEANNTRREAAVRIVENLRAANVSVLGSVLNNRTFPIPAAIYKRL